MNYQNISDFDIIHLADSYFYSTRGRYLTVHDNEKGTLYDIMSSTKFYPSIGLRKNNLISISVTSRDLEEKFSTAVRKKNNLSFVNLHETRIENNFVTYGQFFQTEIPDTLYQLYLDMLNLQLFLDPKIPVSKLIDGKKKTTIINPSKHFSNTSYYQFGKFSSDYTMNIILLRIEESDVHRAQESYVIIGASKIFLVKFNCHAIVFSSNSTIEVPITVSIEKKLYKSIIPKIPTTLVGTILTIYNIKIEDTNSDDINLLFDIGFYDYSIEAIAPFVSSITEKNQIIVKGETTYEVLEEARKKALIGDVGYLKDVHSKRKWERIKYDSNKVVFTWINPRCFFTLMQAYVFIEDVRDIVHEVLMQGDIFENCALLYNSAFGNGFYKGNLLDAKFSTFLRT